MMINTPPSDTKLFGLEVLDLIDELIKPEIKYSFVEKFWDFFTVYAKKKILNKPDNEILELLFKIQKKLNGKFQDLDNSIEINKAEKLGAVKIPMVGELGKVKRLTQVNLEQAQKLAKEIF